MRSVGSHTSTHKTSSCRLACICVCLMPTRGQLEGTNLSLTCRCRHIRKQLLLQDAVRVHLGTILMCFNSCTETLHYQSTASVKTVHSVGKDCYSGLPYSRLYKVCVEVSLRLSTPLRLKLAAAARVPSTCGFQRHQVLVKKSTFTC